MMLNWYAVRCIFRHPKLEKDNDDFLYEERILLWRAMDIDQAIEFAENEANNYAQQEACFYLGLAQAYQTNFSEPKSGSEVFSLMRDDDSEPAEYMNFYFDTGSERQR